MLRNHPSTRLLWFTLVLLLGCTGNVSSSVPLGDGDSAGAALASGTEQTYSGTLGGRRSKTVRKSISIASDGKLTVTLEWDDPSANLGLVLRQGRTVVAQAPATGDTVKTLSRDVRAGESYTAELSAIAGRTNYVLTVRLDATTPPPPTGPSCGDGACNGNETCSTCASDCGQCTTPPTATCGDGTCNGSETCSTCASDCGKCATPPAGLPAGVTLQPIDGGNNYFAKWSNSLPTDKNFFPISVFSETLGYWNGTWDASYLPKYQAMGINGFVALYNGYNTDLAAALKAANMWAFANDAKSSVGNAISGYVYFDEPESRDVCGDMVDWLKPYCTVDNSLGYPNTLIGGMADHIRSLDSTRPIYGQYMKWTAFAGPYIDSWSLPEANAKKWYADPVDIFSYDYYAITDPYDPAHSWTQYELVMNGRYLVNYAKPVWPFIETSEVFPDTKAHPTPAQIVAEVWHSLIAGARGIQYFNHNFYAGKETQHLLVDPNPIYSCATCIQPAVKSLNARIKALAYVLNSDFANGYEKHTGALHTMVKRDDRDGAFYVFAAPTTTAAQTVTFTLAGAPNTTVTVLDENRTITVTGGVFTDSFAGETTVHIYKVN